MHPLIARFINLQKAVAALEKAEQSQSLDSDESALAQAAAANPKLRATVLKAKGKSHPSLSAQQAGIVLATEAAAKVIAQDPVLGPKVTRALSALTLEGASDKEAQHLVAAAVLEESFGGAHSPDAMDTEWLAEALDTLVPVSKVNTDRVEEWLEAFAKKGDPGHKALRLKVAEALLDCAWGDGPQFITTEHVDDTLDQLETQVARSDLSRTPSTLAAFIAFLAEKGVIGPLRLERLTAIVKTAPARSAAEDDEDEEEGDEDDEETEEAE